MRLYAYSLLRSCAQAVCQNASKHFFSSTPIPSRSTSHKLYRRLSPLGDPNVSMVPVLDQWVQEGRDVGQRELQNIIKGMHKYRRFKHALEISQWMTDKRYFAPSRGDVVIRLNLIYKVHGIKLAEEYFKNTAQVFKGFKLYTALLNCYVINKSVEKAEGIMQEIRDMRNANIRLAYNILLGLYYRVSNLEKLEALLHEMEEKGINCDTYAFNTCLSAYAAAADINGIDTIMKRMESNFRIVLGWKSYSVAATAYCKVGLVDKGLEMLKKTEVLMKNLKPNERSDAFDFLLRMYGKIGRRDELCRIWNLYKTKRIWNKVYMSMISSVLMFDDIEGAEKIVDEWESRVISYDFRIPNCVIDAYIKDGHLGKAEALLGRGIAKGGDPTYYTWLSMAGGYIEDNQVVEAIKALKKAIPLCPPHPNPIKDRLATCLDYLEGRGDVKEAEEFIRLLKDELIFSATVQEKLLSLLRIGIQNPENIVKW